MPDRSRIWFRTFACVIGVVTGGGARAEEPAGPAMPAAPETPSVQVFLKAPADLGDLWKGLMSPDYVLLRGDDYARLVRADAARVGAGAVVRSVAVSGRVAADLATLEVEFGLDLDGDGPTWVDVRLDGRTLTAATEGPRDLPLRAAEGGGWQVEIRGRGGHSVRVGALAPVRPTAEGSRLDLRIPEAASTSVDVQVPGPVRDARLDPGGPVAQKPGVEPGTTRLAAELTPRALLGLCWQGGGPASADARPSLATQGSIAVDLEPGAFRTRSDWSVRSLRGVATGLVFRLDPADEVLEVDLGGRSMPAEVVTAGGVARLTLPLSEPLRPGAGQERLVTLVTRRAVATGATRVPFRGFVLADAREQSGAIGVAKSGNLWVTGEDGRGVRQIDPRTELPSTLRVRPATELAYQFTEQPFDLALRVEPAPPQIRVESRTTVSLEAGLARVDTAFDVEAARGRLYDLVFALPDGLEVEPVGPAEVVASSQTGVLPAGLAPVPGRPALGLRLLTVRLTPKALGGGTFTVRLAGRQAVDTAGGEVAVRLVRPIGVSSVGGRLAVRTGPGLLADLDAPADGAGQGPALFRPTPPVEDADWPWAPGSTRPTAEGPVLWLRHDGNPGELPLRLTARPRSVRASTRLAVSVGRMETTVRQEIEVTPRFDPIDHVDLAVPEALVGRWSVEGRVGARRIDLGATPGGGHTTRVLATAEPTRPLRLSLRYRLRGGAGDVEIPRLTVRSPGRDGPEGPVRASVATAAGLAVEATGCGWIPDAAPADRADAETPGDGPSLRLASDPDAPACGALRLKVTPRVLAVLPRLVVSRLALRTVRGQEGALRTTAWFGIESHESAFPFALPAGAALLRVRVGGADARQVEELPDGAGYRVPLPDRPGTTAEFVELEYDQARPPPGVAWLPPGLPGGGLVQQTLWDLRVSEGLAPFTLPAGWTDENAWIWSTFRWTRQPRRRTAGLPAWAAGAGGGPTTATPAGTEPPAGLRSYLYGRAGAPAPIPVLFVSRATLVATCSGSVLLVGGFFLLFWRPPAPLSWWAGSGAVLALATLPDPGVLPLILQSGVIGGLLTALLAVTQRVVERRRSLAPSFDGPAGPTRLAPPGSNPSRTGALGSEDPTVHRIPGPVANPPGSTREHTQVDPEGDGAAEASWPVAPAAKTPGHER